LFSNTTYSIYNINSICTRIVLYYIRVHIKPAESSRRAKTQLNSTQLYHYYLIIPTYLYIILCIYSTHLVLYRNYQVKNELAWEEERQRQRQRQKEKISYSFSNKFFSSSSSSSSSFSFTSYLLIFNSNSGKEEEISKHIILLSLSCLQHCSYYWLLFLFVDWFVSF
jgi:hypothetical protein